jgi:hypothetical protein|tara:strand:+ start:1455 stop:1601 length:147 start_codon:yes stop_codon:yes gene_type:complete
MEMLKTFFKELFGYNDLEKRIRILERKNYWREKYKHGLSQFKYTSNIL